MVITCDLSSDQEVLLLLVNPESVGEISVGERLTGYNLVAFVVRLCENEIGGGMLDRTRGKH